MDSDTWTRYYDEGYSAYYLYNEKTGESVWESDYNTQNIGTADGGEGQQIELVKVAVPIEDGNVIEDHQDEDSLLRNKPRTFRSRDFPRDGPSLSAEEKSNYDLLCYSRFVFLNAILFEAPLAIVEGAIRIGIIAVLLLIKVAYYARLRQPGGSVPHIMTYGREMLLTGAAMLTLLIPGTICIVYRQYSYETDWELRPLPTILGNVDMRRFGTITFSNGSLAINSGALTSSMTNSSSARQQPPSGLAVVTVQRIRDNNQDSWRGTMKWVPREIYNDLCRFINGDNTIQSLNIAL